MPTAHNRNRRQVARKIRLENKRKKNSFPWGILKFGIPLSLILGVLLFIKFSAHDWNGHDKFSFVYPVDAGVNVTVLDPETPEMTTMIIPGDTQVDVAGGYGTLRLKNVWQLGLNERRFGDLLAKTVTKNFLFPTYLWSDKDAISIVHPNVPGLFAFVFFPTRTNIGFSDRISIALFSLKIKNIEKSEIDLAKSQFLHRSTLADGKTGYEISGTTSERLTVYFSDNDFADSATLGKNLNVNIIDASGGGASAQRVGAVIEVMGGKVVSIDRNQGKADISCEIYGKNSRIVKKVGKIFGCLVKTKNTNFDLEIKLGSAFVKTF